MYDSQSLERGYMLPYVCQSITAIHDKYIVYCTISVHCIIYFNTYDTKCQYIGTRVVHTGCTNGLYTHSAVHQYK